MLTDDLSKSRDKIERLLQTIEELQSADSASQMAVKRVERELREEREKNLRLERELERTSAVSRANGSVAADSILRRSGNLAAFSSDAGSRRASAAVTAAGVNGGGNEIKIEIPVRKSSLTKGFL